MNTEPKFFDVSFVRLPKPILSRRQAHRMQIFPPEVGLLPKEAPGDDWDLTWDADKLKAKPEFFEPSFVTKPADQIKDK